MALFGRQAVDFKIYDDQSPTVWGSFAGSWTRHQQEGFDNSTYTSTSTPGASLSFTFSGTQLWLYGGLLHVTNGHGEYVSYPTAEYTLDGAPAGSQRPTIDSTGKFLYFWTPMLADGIHKLDIKVTAANKTNVFVLDYFRIAPSISGGSSSVETSSSVPSLTSKMPSLTSSMPSPTSSVETSALPVVATRSSLVGAIVGGVVGGIAGIVILALAMLWYLLRKRSRGGQAYYFEKFTPADILAGEARIEPFNLTATTLISSTAGSSNPDPQPAHLDSPSSPIYGQAITSPTRSQYTQSGTGPSEAVLTYVSGNSAQPKVGKAALIAQQNQDVQRPTQHRDSGIRFNENREQEAGPSQPSGGIPPTYTPD